MDYNKKEAIKAVAYTVATIAVFITSNTMYSRSLAKRSKKRLDEMDAFSAVMEKNAQRLNDRVADLDRQIEIATFWDIVLHDDE